MTAKHTDTNEYASLLTGKDVVVKRLQDTLRTSPLQCSSLHRRPVLIVIQASLLIILTGLTFVLALSFQSRAVKGPVITSNFQDPSIIHINNTYYAFAGPNGNPDINVLVATAPDLTTWTVQFDYDALPKLGAWAADPGHVWAPDVSQLANGQFVMYYSAAVATSPGKHCIGAATASKALGPYIAQDEPLFCNLAAGGAIDADGFTDPQTERQYIVYKVDGNSVGHGGNCANTVDPIAPTPLVLQEVDPEDGVTFIGPAKTLLINDASDGPNIEAPALYFHSVTKTYVLFYNSRCFTKEPYNIRYAFSTSGRVDGPYEKQPDAFLSTGDTDAKVYIPGGIDLIRWTDTAVFHADLNMGWFESDGSKRVRGVYVIDLEFDGRDGRRIRPGSLY